MNTSVEVVAGRILLRPSFADLLMCQRLGERFRAASRAWEFAATADNARLIRNRFRDIRTTPEFDALLSPVAAAVGDHFAVTSSEQLVTNAEALIAITEPPAPAGAEASVAVAETRGAEDTPEVVPTTLPEVLLPLPPEPCVTVPPGMLTTPWRHQKAAFKFCQDKFAAGFHGLLLAMGMGTGKSLVTCMLLLAIGARRTLIACPLRVIQVWVTQFERHVGIPVVIVPLDDDIGSVVKKQQLAMEKLELARVLGRPFVAVINYDSLWRDPFASWAEKVPWDAIIGDELHRAKSPSSKVSLGLKRLRLRARYRLGLTGTPMPHGPMDIYAQFRFLDIRVFGPSFSAFRAKYAVMGGYQRKQVTGYQHLDELETLMGQIMFRVGSEVLDLPPATEVTYDCVLTGEAARIYRDLEDEFVARVKDGTVTAANAMVQVLRLEQVTGGCVPTDEGAEVRIDSAKLRLLADTIEDIGEQEPTVVFCWFHADLDGVHEACVNLGLRSLELSGRRDELKRWQDGEAQVLAVQIASGSEGVDLTRARYSIFYSIGYRLDKYEQAKKRTHRPGQTKPVTHIHLIARNTVDVKIMRALERRADIIESILREIKN
jgi:SNF2 family DNA or RNA helicase